MQQFSDPHISIAVKKDVVAIRNLLNSAYRGEDSKQGWTTEAHLIEGESRTDDATVEEVMNRPGSVFLKYSNETGEIIGCVNLQQQEGDRLYLGMFSVSPVLQGGGVGKKLLQAAEEYGWQEHFFSIYMTVITVRTELVNWYIRHGYRDTGERKPFVEQEGSGKHLQPLEFMVLEKQLGIKVPPAKN